MIKYPNKKIVNENQNDFFNVKNGTKGMTFEQRINQANEFYVSEDVAHIYKKPTPIKVLKTRNYKDNFISRVEIQKAVFEKKSTTDYNGIYKSFYIDFEAKETKYKSFNIKSNLHAHQKDHLKSISKHGGIGFLMVNFSSYDKVFIIDINKILGYDKSLMPYEYFLENAVEVEQNKTIHLDYLKAVDELLIKE